MWATTNKESECLEKGVRFLSASRTRIQNTEIQYRSAEVSQTNGAQSEWNDRMKMRYSR